MTDRLTSIIIPMFNESSWIIKTLIRCCDIDLKKEIIVVDNNSSDNCYDLVHGFIKRKNLAKEVILLSEKKHGKANAVKKGLSVARGDYVVFHDADLEYDPMFIPQIVKALEEHDFAIGCRVCRPYGIGTGPFIANKILLRLIQKRYSVSISDIFTAQRGFRKGVIDALPLASGNFEMETELTIRALNEGFSFKEIDVAYSPRSRGEGKKINVSDFFSIIFSYFYVSCRLSRRRVGKAVLAPIHRQ